MVACKEATRTGDIPGTVCWDCPAR